MSGAPGGAVVVAGVGGLGTAAAWALSEAGVRRLVLVDPDRIEPSNLPRQILFAPGDAGRAKAEVAAVRLARAGLAIEPVVARLDGGTARGLLAGAGVAIDATDGAASKDLVNEACVRAGVPLVHAAALGSEGRVLDVPAGGRPCLACLFGRLVAGGEPGDTCARVGVWPGVAGATGALAADAALRRLARPGAPSRGLGVLDLAAGHARTLGAAADPGCPVCGASAAPEALPVAPGGAAEDPAPVAAPAGVLDLRQEACPMNLLRARRAVERLEAGGVIELWLGAEGRATVPEGLAGLGHALLERGSLVGGERLLVRRGQAGRAGSPGGSDAWLRRYARQIVLPEVGEEGQRRWDGARVDLAGTGRALAACALHLAAAGVGTIGLCDPAPVGADAGRWPFQPADGPRPRDRALADALARQAGTHAVVSRGASAGPDALRARVGDAVLERRVGVVPQADGALLADHAMRRLLLGGGAPAMIPIRADGTVGS